jgi:hypothetical protein
VSRKNEFRKSGSSQSHFLLYQTEDGQTRIEVRLHDETVWLSQTAMTELFQKDIRTINEHIKNIYDEGELDQRATIRKFRIVQKAGSPSSILAVRNLRTTALDFQ